jgi:hypothetical protein
MYTEYYALCPSMNYEARCKDDARVCMLRVAGPVCTEYWSPNMPVFSSFKEDSCVRHGTSVLGVHMYAYY